MTDPTRITPAVEASNGLTSPLVKICGLTLPSDVEAAAEAGADLLGFILVDWSPRGVNAGTAARLLEVVPKGVRTVGVFADGDPDEVAAISEGLGFDFVQLHGKEPAHVVARFGSKAIKAYRLPVEGTGDPLGLPADLGPIKSRVLLDLSFNSVPTDEQLARHWAAARAAGEQGHPVMLAGALGACNVAKAVAAARPWAVDSARSTEQSPGVKDHDLLRRFVAAARHVHGA